MGRKTTPLSSLGEPLFLGLSCLVGGEQFYILLYGSEVSIRAQSSVLVVTAVITCILSAAMTSKADILANSFHLFYMSVLVLLMIIRNEVTSRGIVTVTTIALGYVLTVLVIQSCSLYSTSRQELLSFILGLFSARYLPSFFRHFVSKGASNDAQIRSVSKALGISRLLFCILSLALKVLMGRFQLTFTESISVSHRENNNKGNGNNSKGFWDKLWSNTVELFTVHLPKPFLDYGSFPEKGLGQGFKNILYHTKYLFDIEVFYRDQSANLYTRYIHEFFRILPIITFLTSVIIFLMYPRTRFSAYCGYSQKLLSTMVNVKMVCHIIGSLVGIGYPMSVTFNSELSLIIHSFFYYSLIVCGINMIKGKKISREYLFFVATDCFVLGYIWSYNLGLVINMVLTETCVYEEVVTFEMKDWPMNLTLPKTIKTCCGEKITDECYCKLEEIIRSHVPFGFKMLFSCSKLYYEKQKTIFTYSKNGKCAILIIYDANDIDCSKPCCECSEDCCKNGECCLKMIGKYKIDAVTVSSCSDCQLTIRLEGTCCCGPGQCPKCCETGGECVCGDNGKCCCICVKCCKESCVKGCCCIHYCKKEVCACECNCNGKKHEAVGVRVFICYKIKEKCCIKEIRQNDRADFVGDLKSKNTFDIDDIFISDCCHTDIRVDLRCTVKNNYFRISGANYPRKFEKPDLVSLLWSESVCCPTPPGQAQCCCMFRSLVRACVMFVGSSVECRNIKGCAVGCKCTNKECCVSLCDLPVDANGGFVKRVNRIRVKLIVIAWLVFGLVFFILALIASGVNKKYSPRAFCPVTSYSKLAGTLVTNKYNSEEQVTRRMVGLVENGKISEQVMDEKKQELRDMLSMFAKYTSSLDKNPNKPKSGIAKLVSKKPKPKEIDKIRDHIVNKASRFTPSSSVSGGRRFDQSLVEWSQCVGLVYKYAMPLFFVIQQFFVAWEEAWRIDLRNYRRHIMPYFMRVTHKSRVSLSTVMGESNVGDKCSESGLDRLGTWNHAFREVKQLSTVTLKEDAVGEESIPLKIGNRLHYYVSRWNHRLPIIRAWCNLEPSLFDWAGFLNEYGRISEWISDVSPGLRCDSEVKVSTKDLNRGIQIFVASK